MKNYHAILDVPEGSSAEEIRQSYQRLTQQQQGDDAALAELKEAYEALASPNLPSPAAPRRCPMGVEAQCPVLLGQVAPGDNFCPECGFLLAGMDSEEGFETAAPAEEQDEIRLEEPNGRSHPLRPGVTVVGRESADILLADKTISRQHARLEVTPDGMVMLEDLGSTNGTQVAGDRLVPNVPRQLFSGDRVRFGSFAMELRLPQPQAAEESASEAETGEETPPAETALARLAEIREEGGRIVFLPPGVTTFGRRADNTVVLPGDPYVSGSHAQILATGDVFRLTDVGSTNGTLLNGERLSINVPMFLNPGDVILIGSTAFRFEMNSDAGTDADKDDMSALDSLTQDLPTQAEG